MKIVNRYIGVQAGYLGDFTYRSHSDFYPEYCDLDIDPEKYHGTTRQRFLQVLSAASPADQAQILRGVLERFPVEAENAPPTRTAALRAELERVIQRLEGATPVRVPNPQVTSKVVERAIADAETLMQTTGATSGVDRIHTALHGHLIAICETGGLKYQEGASLTQLYKLLREQHPKLISSGPRAADIDRILKSLATILDALQPVRNMASVAHPNRDLLEPAEATLVINAARSILHYLDTKVSLTTVARL